MTQHRRSQPHMSENAFQERVTDLCKWLRLRWHHETDSRRTRAGFPDLVIVGPSGHLFAELKSTKGRVSTEQQEWLDDLRACGANVYLWRPEDWPEVQRVLHALAERK